MWGTATLVALTLSWLGPAKGDLAPESVPPAALDRPPSPDEQDAIRRAAAVVHRHLELARHRTGNWPAVSELETMLVDGAPLLPEGLPDNPLVPGVAGVLQACGVVPPAEPMDWWYCDQDGRFGPGAQDPVTRDAYWKEYSGSSRQSPSSRGADEGASDSPANAAGSPAAP